MACDWRRCDGLSLGNDRLKMANICRLPTVHMRIELNYQADFLHDAICQAIVAYLGKGMPPREIIDQTHRKGL